MADSTTRDQETTPAGASAGDTTGQRPDSAVTPGASQTLRGYRLIEVIGIGGMGRVWRAVDRSGNQIAIKTLQSGEALTEAQLRRFRREAEIMARLPHRNICRVLEMNECDGIQYIVMEYVDGLSLADLIQDPGNRDLAETEPLPLPHLIRSVRLEKERRTADPEAAAQAERAGRKITRVLPVSQVLRMMLRVCDAIQFAHEHGVLHRDLKPGNILLREDGEPLVADFGLAKWSASDAVQDLSLSGHVVGTLENMPPEQAESSKDVDERADVYALGTILFQLLTGRRHFEATGNLVADAQALRAHEPPRLRSLNPKIESELEVIVLKALRNNPATRYQSVTALREDLERYRRGRAISARRTSLRDRIRRRIRRNRVAATIAAISAALILATIVAAIASLSWQLRRETAARKEAEELRAEAEFHKKEAEIRRLEAEAKARLASKNESLANEQLARARQLLAEKLAAEKAASEARAQSQEALASQEAERKLRQQTEEEMAEKESQLARALQEMKDIQEARDNPPEESPESGTATQAQNEALAILRLELSPHVLDQMKRNPEQALKPISRGQALLAEALLAQPDDPALWVLKGRFHLAAMEFPEAHAAFSKAREITKDSPSSLEASLDTLTPLASALTGGRLQPAAAAGTLLASKEDPDQATGHILKFFAEDASLPRRTGGAKSSPLGRVPGLQEIALALFLANSLEAPPVLASSQDGHGNMTVTLTGDAKDLSALADLPVTSLILRNCSQTDWNVIARLPLETLDLSSSPIEALPIVILGFQKLRALDISGTGIASLEALQKMTTLETLNASNCPITDLTPMADCRRLKTLDLSGVHPANFRPLLNLPLESLTISLDQFPDPEPLNVLRKHRTLKHLRTPSDPPEQPAQIFWKKQDSRRALPLPKSRVE